ncbi:hypothetical protein B0H14DRAFT_3557810 [Mycena olivaceomarginata]|nr:hypothetical protein B0H14DRAFT_3557810 [Mycena olivaceomarginata]
MWLPFGPTNTAYRSSPTSRGHRTRTLLRLPRRGFKNTTLWILGGLVATTEAALILSQESLVVKVSVDSNKDGPSLEGNIPADVAVVFIHIPLGLKKPGLVSTDWNQGREKGEGELLRKAVQVVTPFPQLESVGEPPNLGIPDGPYTWTLRLEQVRGTGTLTATLEIHQVQERDDFEPGKHSLRDASHNPPMRRVLIAMPNMEQVSPPAPGQIGSLVTMHTALDCKDPTLDDGYPHPILWRVHYATLCVSNWGSAELKALIYGLLRDEEEDEDEDDEDED